MAPLVARGPELDVVAASIAAAADGGGGLIVEGVAGVGKTSLWFAALERARAEGCRVLTARASAAESGLAYAGLADLLGDVDRSLWRDLPTPQRRALAGALLVEDGDEGEPVDPRAVGAAFLAVLTRMAADSTVVVAVDDLQWLDVSTARAVTFAARRTGSAVHWLCTARRDETAEVEPLQLDRPDALDRIHLRPLNVDGLGEVLVAHSAAPVDPTVLRRIHDVSAGNPFYALEMAREMVNRSSVDLVLPDSLASVMRRRLSRVGDDAKDGLLTIACLPAATVTVVADATGVTPTRLVDLLARAEAEGVIVVDADALRFSHPLLAHAVHSEATSSRRRDVHRRLAEVVTDPESRARHLAFADPVGEPATLAALDTAAAVARRRAAPAAAVELLEMAIDRGGGTAVRRIELAQCLVGAGDLGRARSALEAAVDQLDPGLERADALQRLALVRVYDDSFPEAVELGRRALAECQEDSAVRVDVRMVLALAELNCGHLQLAKTTVERCVAAAERLGLAGPLGRALSLRSVVRFMNGEGVSSSELERAVALEDPHALVPPAFRPTLQATLLTGWAGELEACRARLMEMARHCETLGQDGETMFFAFQIVMSDLWLGDLGNASVTAARAQRQADRLGGSAAQFVALSASGAVAAHQGRIEEATRDLGQALSAAAESGYTLMSTWTIAQLGFLQLSQGDHDAAVATMAGLLESLRLLPQFTEMVGGSHLPDVAEAMIAVGRLGDAERIVELLEGNGQRLDRAWMRAVGGRCRALLSAARGDVEAAVAQVEHALAQHDRVDMPFERARTMLVRGRLERRRRRWRAATDAFTEALGVFERLGIPLWANMARGELARGSAGRARSPGLTPSEARVAELIVTGMTNQEVATTLCVARKTVEVYVSRIYQKLGVHSRIELYRAMNARA